MKSVLKICKANSVMIYVRIPGDEEYFLRIFDTRQGKRAEDDLRAEHMSQKSLPLGLKKAMEQDMFYSSEEEDVLAVLDRFSKDSTHVWCLGGPVRVTTGNIKYYVLLGY